MIEFRKYHGLGNDYLVLEPEAFPEPPSPALVRAICDRNRGVGSDGILFLAGFEEGEPLLRIFNPDGSEAEKSGNGLRIFSRWLLERGLVSGPDFHVRTAGGRVAARVFQGGSPVEVDMGRPDFAIMALGLDSTEAERFSGGAGEILDRPAAFVNSQCRISCVSMGNPHCVVMGLRPDPEITRRLGPLIETAALFPKRTNVQFLEVLSRGRIRIEIWERGAGYTLASGSSSCAAAAVARRLGLAGDEIEVLMPGGSLSIRFVEGAARMTGPVEAAFEGRLTGELAELRKRI